MASQTVPDAKELKGYVRSELARLRRGDSFMAIGLDGREALLDENGYEFPDRSDAGHPFNVFMAAVAAAIVEQKGAPKGKKKKIRVIENSLHEHRLKWRSMILTSQQPAQTPRKNVTEDQVADGTETMKVDVDADAEVQSSTQDDDKPTKKMKPSKKRKVPPQKSLSDDEDDDVMSEQALDDDDGLSDLNEDSPVIDRTDKDYLMRKAEFEKERDKVLEDIPEATKQWFGQVCFAKWNKGYLPALVLSPFHLAPPIRVDWLEMFDKVS
jgi:hypothetical protein